MWPLRISFSRLRPINAAAIVRIVIIAAVFALFLAGDFLLFRRLFKATAQIEEATPFFALGLLRNLLAMVFLVATIVLFSSALTAAIGAFFTDLDLDVYHAAPRNRTRIAIARWGKALAQSAAIVFAFLVPLFLAFARQYVVPASFYPIVFANLALLLTIPVSLASVVIVMLVRWFPVRRVHQIVATIAILVFTAAVIAFRVSRPERFFTAIDTDDVTRVLRAIELPSMDLYPSTAIADFMVRAATGEKASWLLQPIAIPAAILFTLFVLLARSAYFAAFVRARESMAPAALGATQVTRFLDRLLDRLPLQPRAMIAKEVRTIGRDVAQWSQVMLMGALLFIYLYNIRMLPLGGDTRATIVAYANLGMAGFVVAAICLRFAYPSVSAEGKAFWIVQSAPIRYRQFLIVKVLVYAAPLTAISVLLTIFANLILDADPVVWTFTLIGAVLLAVTLVALGVGMGAWAPQFAAENPLQVGLSLGGFAYMAVAMSYVGAIMFLMARPVVRYFFWRMFGAAGDGDWIATVIPIVTAVTSSLALMVFPILIAERRLARLGEQA